MLIKIKIYEWYLLLQERNEQREKMYKFLVVHKQQNQFYIGQSIMQFSFGKPDRN